MQINVLTETYSVAGQSLPADVPELVAAGYRTVICNIPDHEVGADETSDVMREVVEKAGLTFVYNPVTNGAITPENVAIQGETVKSTEGPVFAYCRSGMRCSVVWAFSQAGSIPVDNLISAAAKGGYALDGLRPQLEALAAR